MFAARSPGSVSSSRWCGGPPASSEPEAFRVTPLGRFAFTENWPAIIQTRSAPRSLTRRPASRCSRTSRSSLRRTSNRRSTSTLRGLSDLRSVDIYTAFAITWDSLMNALDRGFSAEQLLAFLESVSATGVPATVRQLVEDCEGRHGEVRIGVAGPYIEAREGTLLGELEANPRFAPYIQRRIGDAARAAHVERRSREAREESSARPATACLRWERTRCR